MPAGLRSRPSLELHADLFMRKFRNGRFFHPHPNVTPVYPWDDCCVHEWWAEPRMIIDLTTSKRLTTRYDKQFDIRVNTLFRDALGSCAFVVRPERSSMSRQWMTTRLANTYLDLHRHGFAHSIEAWSSGGALVGAVIVVGERGAFSVETMFHSQSNASKVCLHWLIRHLRESGAQLLDVQFPTKHFAAVGGFGVDDSEYKHRLGRALLRDVVPFVDAEQGDSEHWPGGLARWAIGRPRRLEPAHELAPARRLDPVAHCSGSKRMGRTDTLERRLEISLRRPAP
jgi:leucyl/phenylalanyl-tRNA--protein transferase